MKREHEDVHVREPAAIHPPDVCHLGREGNIEVEWAEDGSGMELACQLFHRVHCCCRCSVLAWWRASTAWWCSKVDCRCCSASTACTTTTSSSSSSSHLVFRFFFLFLNFNFDLRFGIVRSPEFFTFTC